MISYKLHAEKGKGKMGIKLNHVGTVEINTERLLLRRIWFDDAQKMFARWSSDEKTTRYLPWKTHTDLSDTMAFISEKNRRYIDNDEYTWLICLRRPNRKPEPIGMIAVDNIDEELRTCEIGYVIGEKWWGQGIAPEALRAVLELMFLKVGMECVRSFHDTRNSNSGWVMEKCGMKYDGCLRRYMSVNSGPADICFYSILRDEWFAQYNIEN